MSVIFDPFTGQIIDTGSSGGGSGGGTIGTPITGADPDSVLIVDSAGNLDDVPLTDGQLVIGSSTGAPTAGTITGTTDQVIVTNGSNTITLSLPQSIATTSSPTFNQVTLSSPGVNPTDAVTKAQLDTKQPVGNYITALTGDGTATGPGSSVLTLSTVNADIGTFNNVTVNAKGLVTAAVNYAYQVQTIGDIDLTSWSGLVNNTADQVITGFLFPSSVLSFKALIDIYIDNGAAGVWTVVELVGKRETLVDWSTNDVQFSYSGQTIPGLDFNITSSGQVQISIGNVPGFVSGIVKFRAWAIGPGMVTPGPPAGPSPTNYITDLTGDVVASGPGSVPATLATVNSTPGSFTNANITVNGKGLITAASNGTGGGGSGTVTSVALSTPAEFTVSGSPVTTSGTLTFTKATQLANLVYAGPSSGGAAAPTFRSLVSADIPTLNQNTTGTASNVTGVVGITNGGTGSATQSGAFNNLNPMTTTGDMIYENSPLAAARLPIGTAGQVLTVQAGIPAWVTAGSSGITALTGDVTASGSGSVVATLANTGVSASSYTNANITVDAKGRITAASSGTSGTVTSVAQTVPQGFTISGSPITSSGTLAIGLQTEFDAGNSGTAKTLDFNNGVGQKLTLTGNVTLTINNMLSGSPYVLRLVQDGTGSRTVTWPANFKWPGGIAPTLTTTAGAIDLVSIYYDGTNAYASAGLTFA